MFLIHLPTIPEAGTSGIIVPAVKSDTSYVVGKAPRVITANHEPPFEQRYAILHMEQFSL